MTKTLYLIRHAKTHQESDDNRDISRELNPRGMRDAGLVGKYLKDKKVNPDLILSSRAIRATTTAQILATLLKYPIDKIHINDELYVASVRTFLQVVNNLKVAWSHVMIVGHNPVIPYFGEYVSDAEIASMPTSAVMTIEFKCEWADIDKAKGLMVDFITPKMLKTAE